MGKLTITRFKSSLTRKKPFSLQLILKSVCGSETLCGAASPSTGISGAPTASCQVLRGSPGHLGVFPSLVKFMHAGTRLRSGLGDTLFKF